MNFPILRLMKADFINYYKQRGPLVKPRFRKLCFVFNFDSSVTVNFFPLDSERGIMNNDENGIKLTDSGDGSVTIAMPFKTGTLELKYNELSPVIGNYKHIEKDFRYLRFVPKPDAKTYFVGYDVYYNDETTLKARLIPAKKPSPPYGQD